MCRTILTALFAVVRRLESQLGMLAPDTHVRAPVLRQFYCSPGVDRLFQAAALLLSVVELALLQLQH